MNNKRVMILMIIRGRVDQKLPLDFSLFTDLLKVCVAVSYLGHYITDGLIDNMSIYRHNG